MANVVYASAKELFLATLLSSTVKAALVDTNDVSFSAGHDFYDDISAGVVGTPVALTGKTATGGVFDSDDPVWASVSGDEFEAIVLYIDTGSAATSPLIAWYNTGVTNLPMNPNTGDITYVVHASGWFAV